MRLLLGGLGIGEAPASLPQPAQADADHGLYREAAAIFSHELISERRRIALAMGAAHVITDPGIKRFELRKRIGETSSVFAYALGVLTMRPVYTFPLPPPIMQKPFVHIKPSRPVASAVNPNECYMPADSLLWLVAQPPDVCMPLHAALEQVRTSGNS